ncbi:hypothetical protein LTS18_002851 [Coniosporium uncinatum]|uniref:Uncharacterized protein n=1 Tax=Coniosporium uncinatum TaxID=93489 RepID=A0ACC3D7U0_9PEZI|nr:hypothetical protein LTS18_002851 [Coniosporium uncinatum]
MMNGLLKTRNAVLDTEFKAQESQLKAYKDSTRVRILELKSNPTADLEALKVSTLNTLREENKALLAQLEDRLSKSDQSSQLVPFASLERARAEIAKLSNDVAHREKKELRLKQSFASKAAEFREAIFSILGWKAVFEPNGRVKMTSLFYPSSDIDDGEENFIQFDGEKGEMKISGGPRSEFAKEIRGQIEFWVEGRKEIPCFLAALTLEFYERTTRAARA